MSGLCNGDRIMTAPSENAYDRKEVIEKGRTLLGE